MDSTSNTLTDPDWTRAIQQFFGKHFPLLDLSQGPQCTPATTVDAPVSTPQTPSHTVSRQTADTLRRDDDNDTISLTSTINEGGAGSEGRVENVLAKRALYGRDYYLVKWEGCQPERATWEPTESFSDPQATIKAWEKTKATIARGGKEASDLLDLQRRTLEAAERHDQRRRRRREKRAQLGLTSFSTRELAMKDEIRPGPDRPADGLATNAATTLPSAPVTATPSHAVDTAPARLPDATPARPPSPLSAAVTALQEGRYPNPHAASVAMKVNYIALRIRLGLAKPPAPKKGSKKGKHHARKLTLEEEQELVQYYLDRRDNLPPKSSISVKATEILQRRKPTDSFSVPWIDLFLSRHKDVAALYARKAPKGMNYGVLGRPAAARTYPPTYGTRKRGRLSLQSSSIREGAIGSTVDSLRSSRAVASAPTTPNAIAGARLSATTPASATQLLPPLTPLTPGPDVIKFKARCRDETRYLLISTDTTVDEFLERIRTKLGLSGAFKIQIRDDEDMITIGDQEDLNILIALAKEGRNAEIWIQE